MNLKFYYILLLVIFYQADCQPFQFSNSLVNPNADPIITSWIKAKGYSPYLPIAIADINKIQYSSKFVYVSFSSLPSYPIGPWFNTPYTAKDQKYTFKFPRVPSVNTGNKKYVGPGNIGILTNGVGIFNAGDGGSYKNLGIWRHNAYYIEASGFDSCKGHPQTTGLYHVHFTPVCLYNINDTKSHSPLIGFAIDGFPIYGPYGYSNPLNPLSPMKLMQSSYVMRSITKRTTLSNGTELLLTQYGPDVSSSYPLGIYLEDYEFINGLGDLDRMNGRFSITPEYPSGTYAYYSTIDEEGNAAFPYTIASTYNGQVVAENMGGIGAITETTTIYFEF